jgi:hypothetical protein
MLACPSSRLRATAHLLVLGVGLTAGVTGCGATPSPAAPASVSFPRWEGHLRELFDDNIDPAAVGLSMEGPSPRSDPFLRERAQTSELAARVRVQTVTVDSVGDQVTYHLGIQVGVPTLVESKIPERSFELSIRPTSGAFGIAKAFDARLRGTTFIGFIQRFAAEGGEAEIHWHLSADTAEVAAAVKEAVALRELSGS